MPTHMCAHLWTVKSLYTVRTRKAVIWISSTLSARLLEMNQSARRITARDHHVLMRANWRANTNSQPIVGTFERHVDMTSHVPDLRFSILDGGCFCRVDHGRNLRKSSYKWLTGCWSFSTCDKQHTIIWVLLNSYLCTVRRDPNYKSIRTLQVQLP